MTATIDDDGSGVRISYAGGVFMNLFYGPPTKERLDWLFAREQQLIGATPKFSSISIIDPRVGKEMPSDARQRAKEITDHWDGRMIASCTVIGGTGFFAALVRSVTMGILFVSARKLAWHVTSDVDEAVRFVADVHAKERVAIDAGAVREAIAALTS